MMENEAAGCAGIRPFGETDCEMKRLYVRPVHRGKGVGKKLAETAVEVAKELGYRRMYLDTLASMNDATKLYRLLGFKETEPYTYNPLPNVLYFALDSPEFGHSEESTGRGKEGRVFLFYENP